MQSGKTAEQKKQEVRVSLTSLQESAARAANNLTNTVATILVPKKVNSMSKRDLTLISAEVELFKNKPKGSKLYIVGLPVVFSSSRGMFRDDKTVREDLLKSFDGGVTKIKLMRTELEALTYAHAARLGKFGKDAGCSQPSVIEVRLAKSLSYHAPQGLDISNSDGIHQDKSILFVEVDASYVIPMKAKFKIYTNEKPAKIYPEANFRSCLPYWLSSTYLFPPKNKNAPAAELKESPDSTNSNRRLTVTS